MGLIIESSKKIVRKDVQGVEMKMTGIIFEIKKKISLKGVWKINKVRKEKKKVDMYESMCEWVCVNVCVSIYIYVCVCVCVCIYV